MALKQQAGYALVEVAFAAAVISIGVAGLLAAMALFARFASHPDAPVRSAAARLAEQTVRVGQDAFKYGSPDLPHDAVWQTHLTITGPDAGLTSVPVSVRTHVDGTPAGAAIEVAVSYEGDARDANRSATVTLRGDLAVLAPVPGSSITRPGLVPDPSIARSGLAPDPAQR